MKTEDVARQKDMVRGKPPRFLFLDIETSPVYMAAWGVYEQDALWHKRGEILMMGYQFSDEKHPSIVSQRQFDDWTPRRTKEKKLMWKIHELMDQADVVIGYNAKKFDVKQINARFMIFNIPEPRYLVLDPLNMITRSARFPSHKLEDVAEYLKIGRKMETGGKYLWKRCIEGDMSAWKKMEEYCMNDVVLVKKVFERLRQWDKTTFNYAFYTRDNMACKKCGCKDLKGRGRKFYRTGYRADLECRRCSHRMLGPLIKEGVEQVNVF